MSLLNFRADPDRLIVACDTAADLNVDGKVQRGESSKCWHIAHANCIVAVRGNGHIAPALVYLLALSPARCFDDFSTVLASGVLDEAVLSIMSSYEASGSADPSTWLKAGDEVTLGGWSDRAGRMVGQRFVRDAGSEKFIVCPIGTWGINPGDPFAHLGANAAGVFDKDDALLDAAREQVAWARANCPGMPIGGRLLCFELTRHGAAFRDLGLIPAGADNRAEG